VQKIQQFSGDFPQGRNIVWLHVTNDQGSGIGRVLKPTRFDLLQALLRVNPNGAQTYGPGPSQVTAHFLTPIFTGPTLGPGFSSPADSFALRGPKNCP
jgi:hypothetical protein